MTDGNVRGPIYQAPLMGQGVTGRHVWPTTREGIDAEYTRRVEAYTGADYADADFTRLNLFVAKNGDNQITAATRRVTADIRFVVAVDAASIASDGVSLQVRELALPGGLDAAPVALDFGGAVWSRSGLAAGVLSRWAINLCVYGDVWLEVQRGEGGAVIVAHDPRHVHATMDATGMRCTRLVVTYEYQGSAEIDMTTGQWTGKPETHTYRRMVTPEAVTVWRDDKMSPAESGPNPLGAVPVVRVSYRSILDGTLSEWAGTGYEAAAAMVDSARSQVQAIVTRHANPILAMIGARLAAGESLQTIGKTIALPDGASIAWLEAELTGVQVALNQADSMRTAMQQTLPEFLFVESGASASGTALSYRAGAFVAKIEPIRQAMYRALALCVGWGVAIDRSQRWTPTLDVYQVDGGDALPMDVAASASLYVSLGEQGWLTGPDVVRRLQGLQLVSSDEDPAGYYARAQGDKAARDGGTLAAAADIVDKLTALEAGERPPENERSSDDTPEEPSAPDEEQPDEMGDPEPTEEDMPLDDNLSDDA